VKILIDMNLSPAWGVVLAGSGWEAIHWTDIGMPTAPDGKLMLDFGALLAATGATGPSVVQMRCEDTRPVSIHDMGQQW